MPQDESSKYYEICIWPNVIDLLGCYRCTQVVRESNQKTAQTSYGKVQTCAFSSLRVWL